MKKFLSALTLFIAVASFVPVSLAGFSMVPSNSTTRRQFNYELKPGDTKTDSIIVENNNNAPLALLLYGADATHSNQGSFALVNRTATQRTVGSWVTFKDSTVTLKPGEKREIPFTITMPANITPGNYAGGIAAETTAVQDQTKSGTSGGTGAGVVISSRLVVKLFIAVPGEKTVKYNWTDFSRIVAPNNKQRFNFSYSNDGNAAIAVEAKIDFTSLFGDPAEEVKIPGTTLLQNEKVTIPYDWDKEPFFGYYTATATTTFWEYDVANNQNINPVNMTKTITFWIIPWNIAAVVIAIIAIILIYVISKMLIMGRLKKSSKLYEVQTNDTLVTIADKAGVKWKKLAKLNKLKAPYNVKKGDKLQVPFKK